MGPDPDDPRKYWGYLLIRLIIRYFWKHAEIRAVRTEIQGTSRMGWSKGWDNADTHLIFGIMRPEYDRIYLWVGLD